MRRAVPLLALLALGACSGGGQTFSFDRPTLVAPARPGAPETNPAVAAACREEVTRVLARQDRSQLIREDERDARLGAEATPFTQRAPQDRLGRQFAFERMIDDCVRDNTQRGVAPAAATPAAAPETVPAAPTRRGPR